mmetsp:Transcript_22554/g.49879  ORF Transcript_22554/g.49879 Transcript_22554/m.49879 type:complete len:131 (+) Transcript_22554:69-461(+)
MLSKGRDYGCQAWMQASLPCRSGLLRVCRSGLLLDVHVLRVALPLRGEPCDETGTLCRSLLYLRLEKVLAVREVGCIRVHIAVGNDGGPLFHRQDEFEIQNSIVFVVEGSFDGFLKHLWPAEEVLGNAKP